MVQRFAKGERYTLCLVENVDNEPYTWVANVLYTNRLGDILEFHGDETYYTVDITNKLVFVASSVLEVYVNEDTGLTEYDEVEQTRIVYLTNIVKGWQY